MLSRDLKPLFDAVSGKQPEKDAVRTVAAYAVIPGSMFGMLASALMVPMNAPPERLFLVGGIGTVLGALAALLLVFGVYRRFRFLAVARLVYGFFGALGGLVLGTALGWRTSEWVPYALAGVGMLLAPFLLVRRKTTA